MFLLKALPAVISNPKEATVMADWLEEFANDKPEVEAYVRWLRNWSTVTLTVLLDTVAKFGTKEERHLIKRLSSRSFRRGQGRKRQRKAMRGLHPGRYYNVTFRQNLTRQIDLLK